ncbi:hypothetical protein, partial [Komagataeibacter swingsii]|uniref:hypothetical protein n=1 Tax=Komagataeibacter swingsii TaxID=215220 RepID=UPI001C3FF71E
RSKKHCQGTSVCEVPLMPYVGHKALIVLAQWMARHDEPESGADPVDGFAARATQAACRHDQRPDSTPPRSGSGRQS